MMSLGEFRATLTDESLRFAVLVGLASIPFTLALSWNPLAEEGITIGGSVSGTPVLLAGVVIGYRYNKRATESRRAGFWTGLVGSIATAIVFTANTITTLEPASSRMTALAVVLTPVFVAVAVGFTVVVTTVAAMITDWVTTRIGPAGGRPPNRRVAAVGHPRVLTPDAGRVARRLLAAT